MAGVLMDAAGCAFACVRTVVCGCPAGDVFLLNGVPVAGAVTTVTAGEVLATEVDPVLAGWVGWASATGFDVSGSW